jgi:hypothetical protein
VTRLGRALVRIDADLRQLRARFALVGGLAVSARVEPRTTRDIDVAIAVNSDREAESLVWRLGDLGYVVQAQLEHEPSGRLSTVRLVSPGGGSRQLVIDLLFASSGIENELVDAADTVEVLRGVIVPVATSPYLLALKVLAGRPHDLTDAMGLVERLDDPDIALTRRLLDLISSRGFDRGGSLQERLDTLLRSREGGGAGF